MSAPSPVPDFVYTPPMEPYLKVLHADDDLLVVDKPSGLLSVPGKAEAHSDCLERRAQATYPQARIVHRLDMDTSGVMVLAMNAVAHRHLGLQFERRKVRKTYIADVWGLVSAHAGEIALPLICDWPNRPKQKVCFDNGKAALTRWEVLERANMATRIRLFPHTGRSHQLRVHMMAMGHVILGDRFYADGAALHARGRLALHAESLDLHHPVGGDRRMFSSKVDFVLE